MTLRFLGVMGRSSLVHIRSQSSRVQVMVTPGFIDTRAFATRAHGHRTHVIIEHILMISL